MEQITLSVKIVIRGDYLQFQIRKLQQSAQRSRFRKILVLRSQNFAIDMLIFQFLQRINQAGNTAISHKRYRKEKFITMLQLKQQVFQYLYLLLLVIGQYFRQKAIVSFNIKINKARLQIQGKFTAVHDYSISSCCRRSTIGISAAAQSKLFKSADASHFAATCSFITNLGCASLHTYACIVIAKSG